ncbi:MAG: hypothetical protein HZA51_04065 [Planctomycetes bacterium]|nr:hypothetical protein [Planctomycetota bacterium]
MMPDDKGVNRTVFQLDSLDKTENSVEYWRQRTPDERFEAIETLRQIMYGYDPTTERLQRVIEYSILDDQSP